MIVKTDTPSLVIKGEGGLGKSHTVMAELENLGLTENINYFYITGHVTPKELFNIIGRSAGLQKPQLIVFDDVDSLVENKTSVALLKASLGAVRGRRIVSYHSSRGDGKAQVEFDGKVIMILNSIRQETALGRPLLDRCITFSMDLSPKETVEYIDSIIYKIDSPLSKKDRTEIWDKVRIFAGNSRFSVRSVDKAFRFYKYNKENWYQMLLSSLQLSDDQRVYYKVSAEKDKTAKERASEFARLTNKSTRSYYRIKKQ